MGYTYNHDQGTKQMQENLGLSDDQIINKFDIPEDAECDTALRELMDAGCNIVFATSFGFEDYMVEVAKEYPDVQFCHCTGYQAAETGLANLHNYFPTVCQARYLTGMVAGAMTKKKTISKWRRLDNTANIFPVIASESMSQVFRVSVTLKKEVRPELLQQALEDILPHISNFRVRLRRGLFCSLTLSSRPLRPSRR